LAGLSLRLDPSVIPVVKSIHVVAGFPRDITNGYSTFIRLDQIQEFEAEFFLRPTSESFNFFLLYKI